MKTLTFELEHCYGIKSLTQEFDFSDGGAYAIYAPNGVMKTSLAKTLKDVAEKKESRDEIFLDRITTRKITDENNQPIPSESVFVVGPYDEELGVTEQTSTLLLDADLREEYDQLLRAAKAARDALIDAVRSKSGSKLKIEHEISTAVMQAPNELNEALIRLRREVEELRETPLSEVAYDKIFNEKVLNALNNQDLKESIEMYAERYNELLSTSIFFRKGTFDYYNAGQIAKSLTDNGFFDAKHTVRLNSDGHSQEIESKHDLEQVILREKERILEDVGLRRRFDKVAAQLSKNRELREFYAYVRDNAAVLSRLNNPDKLKQEVIKSYLKTNEDLYDDWMSKYDDCREQQERLEKKAEIQRTQWESVIETFNSRFIVPFILEARNKAELMLGQTSIIDLGFTYVDGGDMASIGQDELRRSLSTGERKAFYMLYVLFEIETRKKSDVPSLVVVDDLADSFDYKNKYAIIQYLKDISEDDRFNLLMMTHNFDFFRTIQSRFVAYSKCLMATKTQDRIELNEAHGIKNIFLTDWKPRFFEDKMKKIACIPFLRNLIEMSTGSDGKGYAVLTSMLHWKDGSETITVRELDEIFNDVCGTNKSSPAPDRQVCDLVLEQAEYCLTESSEVKLENKVVLAIATRLKAERFMIDRISDSQFLASLKSNQYL